MSMWLPKKMQLLGWSESLKRSSTELPADFDQRLTALRSKWDQLEVGLSLFSLLYYMFFSNAAKELWNVRVLFWKSLLKAQSITSVRGPFVEKKGLPEQSALKVSAALTQVSVTPWDWSLLDPERPAEMRGNGRVGKIWRRKRRLECKKKWWRHCQYKNAM